MKNSKTIRMLLGVMLMTFIILSVIGYSYAYFSLEIEGTPKDIVMSTGDLRLEYKDETELVLEGAMPGDEVSKVITVKNIGTKSAKYSLYWGDLINTIDNYELHITLDCKSYTNYGEDTQTESGTCDRIYRAVPISSTVTTGNIKKGISIEPGITQEYVVTVKFDKKTYPQDNNINKTFTGKIGIEEYTAPKVVNCTFDGEMVQGAEYVNGQYTYRYNQTWIGSKWDNRNFDGWGVTLTDKESTEPVTSKVCTTINGKYTISASNMFGGSKATSIDLNSFNTEHIIDMGNMFKNTEATIIIGLDNFITSNVTYMHYMFLGAKVQSLDLTSFDTSKITSMAYMFKEAKVQVLDLSSFDTSKVGNMQAMFSNVNVVSVDVSSFDTSNVTDMSMLFDYATINYLDISNFNTSKVTSMQSMLSSAKIPNLDISNFDTSNLINASFMFAYFRESNIKGMENLDTSRVTNMTNMFVGSNLVELNLDNFNTANVVNMTSMFKDMKYIKSLDLKNFDTSNVTSMYRMFEGCVANSIVGLENFDTSKVTNMSNMFYCCRATNIDVSNFDTSNVTSMKGMFNTSSATLLDLRNFDTSSVTDMSYMFVSFTGNVIGFEKFNTSKVTDMSFMFSSFKINILDLSNFDTSNVTTMNNMFDSGEYNKIILDKFNTSSVIDMSSMFKNVKTQEIDLSSFDTSKVTNMNNMFAYSTVLKTVYVSDKFVTDSLTKYTDMFKSSTKLVGGAGTVYDADHIDKEYARVDGGTSLPGYFTLKN